MTKNQRQQFYTRLRKAKSKFNWFLGVSKEIRAKHGNALGTFCPITAISYNETGKFHPNYNAVEERVDVKMKLSGNDRGLIMEAADKTTFRGNENDKKEIQIIRKTMLRILGLSGENT